MTTVGPTRRLRGARRLLLAALLLLAACSSSAHDKPAPRYCDPAGDSAPLLGGPTALVQSDTNRDADSPAFYRVDVSSGKVVARCTGATAVTDFAPAPSDDAHLGGGVTVYASAGTGSSELPAYAEQLESALVSATGIRDWRSGKRTALRFRGWYVASVTADGYLLQDNGGDDDNGDRNPAGPKRTTTAADYCLLPSITDARARCRPISGASGAGFPVVTPAGRVRWVPDRPVRARFGSLHGWALTDGTGIYGFNTDSSHLLEPNMAVRPFTTTLDGRAMLLDSLSTLRWATVDRVDSSGVHGTLHTSRVPRSEVQANNAAGAVVSRDGRTLHVLQSARDDRLGVEFASVTEGSSHAVVRPIRQRRGDHLLATTCFLVSWPGSAGVSSA